MSISENTYDRPQNWVKENLILAMNSVPLQTARTSSRFGIFSSTAPKVLVFSLAIHGYRWRHAAQLASHKRYCTRHGYRYVNVTKGCYPLLGQECVWLKVTLMLQALDYGYDWVVCLDADTEIQPNCPQIESLEKADKSVYVAKGYSGRLNSGVMIIQNKPSAYYYLHTALRNRDQPVPEEDDVGWGENGHLIHFARNQDFVAFIDKRWNNNHTTGLDDYIRHFSHGPLYRQQPSNILLYSLFKLENAVVRTMRLFLRWRRHQAVATRYAALGRPLTAATRQLVEQYPEFGYSPCPYINRRYGLRRNDIAGLRATHRSWPHV